MAKGPFRLKSGNSPMFKMMGSEMIERAHKSRAKADLLKQLTPEEKAKYDALSGKEKFHVGQNTDLSQMRQALAGDDMDDMEGGVAAAGAAAGAATRGLSPFDKVGLMDSKGEGWGSQETPKMKDLPFGSQARIDEYDRRGWAHDETTTGHKIPKIQPTVTKLPESDSVADPKMSDVKVDKNIQAAGMQAAKNLVYDTTPVAKPKKKENLFDPKARKSKGFWGRLFKGQVDTQYRGKTAKQKIAERKKKKGY